MCKSNMFYGFSYEAPEMCQQRTDMEDLASCTLIYSI